jgi:hypothetical protein
MPKSGFYMHIEGFEGFDRSVDFDKAQIRKAMRAAGRLVVKEAQSLVSGGPSGPGKYPAKRTGRLRKSIKARVSRSGFLVRVEPKTGGSVPASDPYFAYLHYGVRKGASRRKDHQAQAGGAYRIAPRANYMADALQHEAPAVRSLLSQALAAGLRIK